MGKLDFVAVDFETATNDRMACQVGLVVVKNGYVVEKREILICPPDNRFDTVTMRVHGITPDMTQHCDTFDKVWKDIAHYFDDGNIVAHNASFDRDVLVKNLDFYGIDTDNICNFDCTYQIYGKNLKDLCELFHIDYSMHHDALFDAECCAKFYKAYLISGGDINNINIQNSDCKYLEEQNLNHGKKSFHENIKGDVLKKDLTNADPNSPFYDKKVVITGVFDLMSREEIAINLKECGADIDKGITKRTNIVIVGKDPGPKKMEKIDQLAFEGIDIRVIYEEELLNLLSSYMVYKSADVKKCTIELIEPVKIRVGYKFKGIAKACDEGFNVGVYVDGEFIGYIMQNIRIYNTLLYKMNGEVSVWGYLNKEDYFGIMCYVEIPLMCTEKRIDKAKEQFNCMCKDKKIQGEIS